MPHHPTLPTLKCPASPLLLLGVPGSWLEWAQEWVCADRPLPLEPPLHVFLGFLPKTPGLAPLEEDCVDLTIETRFLTYPHQGIYLMLLIYKLFCQLILLGGGYCGCCHLGFCYYLGLSYFSFFLSLSAFFKKMHIIKVRVGKTKSYTIPDALLTPMEQMIL